MTNSLRTKLIESARKVYCGDDPSHDFSHILRVLSNVEVLSKCVKVDLDILIPAALFHDVVNHPKNSPKAKFSADESAEYAKKILEKIKDYPQEKIPEVVYAVSVCSFKKGIVPDSLEAKVLQDADGLEATGAIAITRTFSSAGQMKTPLYDLNDPFCRQRQPDSYACGLDLFYDRLLKITERCHTKKAKQIAKRRTKFLREFLKEFEKELKEK